MVRLRGSGWSFKFIDGGKWSGPCLRLQQALGLATGGKPTLAELPHEGLRSCRCSNRLKAG